MMNLTWNTITSTGIYRCKRNLLEVAFVSNAVGYRSAVRRRKKVIKRSTEILYSVVPCSRQAEK